MNFQRGFELENKEKELDIFNIVRDTLIGQGVVFFGSLAHGIYSTYMPKKEGKRIIQKPRLRCYGLEATIYCYSSKRKIRI